MDSSGGMPPDPSQANVLDLITSGEEWLASIMKGISEILAIGRITAFPVDKQQLATLTNRIAPIPEILKGISDSFLRLRLTEELINSLVPDDVPVEELISLQSADDKENPQTIENTFKNKVDRDLWKEYEDLKDKLLKQDAYIKRIADAERMFLQEVNCVLYP